MSLHCFRALKKSIEWLARGRRVFLRVAYRSHAISSRNHSISVARMSRKQTVTIAQRAVAGLDLLFQKL